MEQVSPLMQKANKLNKDIEEVFNKPDVKPIAQIDNVYGLVLIRFTGDQNVHVTCLGRIDLQEAAIACIETLNKVTAEEEQKRNLLAT